MEPIKSGSLSKCCGLPRSAALFFLLFFAVWGSRAGLGLYASAGIDDYFSTGYSLFTELARTWLSEGVIYFDHPHCTLFSEQVFGARPPLYPLFIAAVIALSGGSAACFIVVQTFVSTLTVAVAALTAFRIGGRTSALFTFLFCGFHPYLFAHSTKIQETVLFEFFAALALYFLFRILTTRKARYTVGFALAAALATYTRATFQMMFAFLLLPLVWEFRREWLPGARQVALAAGVFALCLAPWMIRNHRLTGMATMSTLSGHGLVVAHNPHTFDHFPYKGSIDDSESEFQQALRASGEYDRITAELATEKEFRDYFKERGIQYILAHPWDTFREGCYKVLVNYLGVLSPLQGSWVPNAVYFAAYWFLTLLAIFGARDPRALPYLAITVALLVAHSAYSFVFWAHSSHRSYLDPVWCVLAGVGAARLLALWGRPRDDRPAPTRAV